MILLYLAAPFFYSPKLFLFSPVYKKQSPNMDVLKVSLNLLVVLSSDGSAFQEYFKLLMNVLFSRIPQDLPKL